MDDTAHGMTSARVLSRTTSASFHVAKKRTRKELWQAYYRPHQHHPFALSILCSQSTFCSVWCQGLPAGLHVKFRWPALECSCSLEVICLPGETIHTRRLRMSLHTVDITFLRRVRLFNQKQSACPANNTICADACICSNSSWLASAIAHGQRVIERACAAG